MMTLKTTLLFAGAAAVLAACGGESPTAPSTPAAPAAEETREAAPVAEDMMVEPMAETETDPNQIGTASVSIGIQNGAPYFKSAGEGFCTAGGSCQSGVTLDTGDVDLSGFPPGDILITISLDATAIGAGYAFPAGGYDAVAITVYPPGGPKPDPAFGQQYWPSGFLAPSVAADQHSVLFSDLESDQNVYEYSIAINGPNGRVVLDPKVTNGGVGNR